MCFFTGICAILGHDGGRRARASSSSPSCPYHGDVGGRGLQVAHEADAQVREEWNPERGQVRGSLYRPATADRQRTTHARERPCVPSSATPGSVGVLLLFRTLREGKSSFAQTSTVTCNRSRYLVAGLVAWLESYAVTLTAAKSKKRNQLNLIIDIRGILQRDFLKSLASSLKLRSREVEVAEKKDWDPGGLHSPRSTLMNHVDHFWKEKTRLPERDLFQRRSRDSIPRFSSARVFPRPVSVRKRRVSEVWRLLEENLCDTRWTRIRGTDIVCDPPYERRRILAHRSCHDTWTWCVVSTGFDWYVQIQRMLIETI